MCRSRSRCCSSGDWLVPTHRRRADVGQAATALLAVGDSALSWFGDGYLRHAVARRWPRHVPVGAFVGLRTAAPLASVRLAGWLGCRSVSLCSPLVVVPVWPTAEIDPLFACLTAASRCGVLADRASRVNVPLAGVGERNGRGAVWRCCRRGRTVLPVLVAARIWFGLRHRRLALLACWHFVPMLADGRRVASCHCCWAIYDDLVAGAGHAANEESVGRIAAVRAGSTCRRDTCLPGCVPCSCCCRSGSGASGNGAARAMPAWRAADLTLRMCSGGAVLARGVADVLPRTADPLPACPT